MAKWLIKTRSMVHLEYKNPQGEGSYFLLLLSGNYQQGLKALISLADFDEIGAIGNDRG